MNTLVKKCVERYLANFGKDQGASVLLFGSALDENWTAESDIDLFLIAGNLETGVERQQIDGVTLEIQKDNYRQLLHDLESERGGVRHRNLATMLATAQIVKMGSSDMQSGSSSAQQASGDAQSGPNALARLQQKAQEVLVSDTRYNDEDKKAWHESIVDYLDKCERDLSRQDPTAFQIDSLYVIQNLLDLYLATHNSYWPQPKALAERLTQIDPAFADVFAQMASAPTLEQKLDLLQALAKMADKDL